MGCKAVPYTVTLASSDLILGKKVASSLSVVKAGEVVEAELCVSLPKSKLVYLILAE